MHLCVKIERKTTVETVVSEKLLNTWVRSLFTATFSKRRKIDSRWRDRRFTLQTHINFNLLCKKIQAIYFHCETDLVNVLQIGKTISSTFWFSLGSLLSRERLKPNCEFYAVCEEIAEYPSFAICLARICLQNVPQLLRSSSSGRTIRNSDLGCFAWSAWGTETCSKWPKGRFHTVVCWTERTAQQDPSRNK